MADSIPTPVPPSEVAIVLPQDHYSHPDAPTEWWWHTGTLNAGDRVFGFEINAARFGLAGFTETMLTDVAAGTHYQTTTLQNPENWAATDPANDWYVRLGNPDSGPNWVSMNAPQIDPMQGMAIKAGFVDDATGTVVSFDLLMSQDGPPLNVWGTGVKPSPPQAGGVTTNNYYYSLTRLDCSGAITLGSESFDVTGLTWMDHEYGYFGTAAKPVQWFLQAMQLNNGVHISHYVSFDAAPPALNTPTPSFATVQFPDGTTYCPAGCTMTPIGETWTSPDGTLFFLQFEVAIPAFNAALTVTSLVADQVFPSSGHEVYEGVATATGTFAGVPVSGTAWNEQKP